LGKKEKESIKNIKTFNPDYISVSWGKDSVVLAHLAIQAGNYNFAWFRNQFENNYCTLVRDCFLKKYEINYVEFNKNVTEKEVINNEINFHLLKIHKQAEQKFGKKYATGIRTQESGIRKITIKKNNIASNNRISPIAHWTTQDIFSYLAKNNLPIHPNYAMLGAGKYNRNKIRVGPLSLASQFGNKEWEQEYYIEELRRKKNKFSFFN